MRRINFLSSAAVFAAPTFAAQTDASAAKASRTRQESAKDTPAPGAKAVYLRPNDTAADILVRLESFAEAGIRFLSSIVVHMVVRNYSPVDADRVTDNKALMVEIEGHIQEWAKGKRSGKTFEHAWTSRIMQTAKAMCIVILKSGNKGVAGPLSDILRARKVETANDIVYAHCMQVTKGATAFTALTKALSPAKAKKSGTVTPKNATKPVVGTAKAVALRLMSDTGHEVFNATPGKNAAAKAIKLADGIGKSNVDHKAFVLRSLAFIDSAEALLEIAEKAQELAKALTAGKDTVVGENVERQAS